MSKYSYVISCKKTLEKSLESRVVDQLLKLSELIGNLFFFLPTIQTVLAVGPRLNIISIFGFLNFPKKKERSSRVFPSSSISICENLSRAIFEFGNSSAPLAPRQGATQIDSDRLTNCQLIGNRIRAFRPKAIVS